MSRFVWSRKVSQERFPLPVSPLGWSLLQKPLEVNLDSISSLLGFRRFDPEQVVTRIGCYVYTREPFFEKSLRPPVRVSRALSWLFAFTKDFFAVCLRDPSLFWRFPLHLFQVLRKTAPICGSSPHDPIFQLVLRILEKRLLPSGDLILKRWEIECAESVTEMRKSLLQVRALPSDVPIEALKALTEKLEAKTLKFMELDFAIYFMKKLDHGILRPFFATLSGELTDATLISQSLGLEGNITETSKDRVREQPSGRRLDFARAEVGHLTDNWDVISPVLGESEPLLQMYVSNASESRWKDRFLALKLERETRSRELFARAAARGADVRAIAVGQAVLRQFQGFILADEEHRFHASQQFPAVRALFSNIGKHLASKGVLQSPEDLYFLFLDEVFEAVREPDSAKGVQEKVFARKAEWRTALDSSPAVRLDPRTLMPLEAPSKALSPSSSLQGVAGSPGQAAGPVFWASSASDLLSLKGGEVVFCATPHPAYVPFYGKMAALVCETGGILSHAILSAREWDLPALVNVPSLKGWAENGEVVTVDATQGLLQKKKD